MLKKLVVHLYKKWLYKRAGVVGVGIGNKVKGGEVTSKKCVLVAVKKKKVTSKIKKKDLVPKSILGVPTDVIEVGDVEYMWRKKHRPVKISSSACWIGLTACLPEGEYVYSNNGVQEINLCLDSVLSKRGEEQNVVQRFKNNITQQKLVNIRPYYLLPVRMTREHPILIHFFDKKERDEWYGARALYNEFKRGEIKPYLKVKKLKIGNKKIDPLFSEFIGWYISEGSTRIKETKLRGSCYRIDIANSDKTNVERIKYLAEELFGVSPVIEKRNGRPNNLAGVRFQNKKLALWLKENCGHLCQNKKIPDMFFDADKETLESLMVGLIRGDGWRYRSGFGYVTTSRLLAHQLQLILLKLGIVPSCGKYKQNGKGTLDRYQFNVDFKTNRRYYKEDKDYWYIPIKEIDLQNFAGYVYNIKTDDETFSVPFIVHNCSAGLPLYDKEGNSYMLMNKHCAAPFGSKVGDAIVQPSPLDGGTIKDKIGEITEYFFPEHYTRKDNIDYALVKLDTPMAHEDVEGNRYMPVLRDPQLGQKITKGSRTIQEVRTSSPIISTDFEATVRGKDGNIYTYPNCVLTLNVDENGKSIVEGGCSSSIGFIAGRPSVQTFAGSPLVGVYNKIQNTLNDIYMRFGLELFLEPQIIKEGWVALGSWFRVNGLELETTTGVNFRKEPGLDGERIEVLQRHTKLKTVGEFIIKDNYIWTKCTITN